jgi:hypothetical protein
VRATETRLVSLAAAAADHEQADLFAVRLRAVAAERRGIAEQLADANVQATAHGASHAPDALDALCRHARRGLDRLDADGWRRLLVTLVDEIRVNADRRVELYGSVFVGTPVESMGALLARPSRRTRRVPSKDD